jgi:hypothetical protein
MHPTADTQAVKIIKVAGRRVMPGVGRLTLYIWRANEGYYSKPRI